MGRIEGSARSIAGRHIRPHTVMRGSASLPYERLREDSLVSCFDRLSSPSYVHSHIGLPYQSLADVISCTMHWYCGWQQQLSGCYLPSFPVSAPILLHFVVANVTNRQSKKLAGLSDSIRKASRSKRGGRRRRSGAVEQQRKPRLRASRPARDASHPTRDQVTRTMREYFADLFFFSEIYISCLEITSTYQRPLRSSPFFSLPLTPLPISSFMTTFPLTLAIAASVVVAHP